MDTTKQFLCMACQTFGDFGKVPAMLVPCVLCGTQGGSVLPVTLGTMEVGSVQINQ